MRQLTEDVSLILDSLQDSSLVEVKVGLEHFAYRLSSIALFVITVLSLLWFSLSGDLQA